MKIFQPQCNGRFWGTAIRHQGQGECAIGDLAKESIQSALSTLELVTYSEDCASICVSLAIVKGISK